jgi:catechol 2,3-dioxygenase-like lactoylglutathione lyase family enzyme
MSDPRPPSLGLRHAALRVHDLAGVERFFVRALGYEVGWRPDPDNVYLRRSGDDVALHREPVAAGKGMLDHLGIFVPSAADVDAWERYLDGCGAECGARVVRRPRTHRDGARSLYVEGPEGILVQVLHHP